jgi:hypothetical protein
MPILKLQFKPGVNRENTRYTTEGGWYTSEKVRFRQGTPEKIGGWERISANTFKGLCRSLWAWVTNALFKLTGVMTQGGPYVEENGVYALCNAYTALADASTISFTTGSSIAAVTMPLNALIPTNNRWIGASVQLFGWTTTTGNINPTVVNGYQTITAAGTPSYLNFSVDIGVVSNVTTSGSVNVVWLEAISSILYSQNNFGKDLVFNRRGGNMCVWRGDYAPFVANQTFTTDFAISPNSITTAVTVSGTYNYSYTGRIPIKFWSTGTLPAPLVFFQQYYMTSTGSGSSPTNQFTIYTVATGGSPVTLTTNGTGTHYLWIGADKVSDIVSAAGNDTTDAPTACLVSFVSDIYRFAFAFGVNDYKRGDTYNLIPVNPMLIRWCDQEDLSQWTPAATNQAGSLLLSRGSEIITVIQARQEILVWTDVALYSLQYQGAPTIWGAQLLGDNISIINQNAVSYAAGTAFWMGGDKFYIYNGNINTLNCDLRQYIFGDINLNQTDQIFSGTSEGFNEVWWFYCSAESSTINRYVIYNYAEKVWYYGSLARTAWLDSGLRDYPLAATYSYNLVNHEKGVDDNVTGTPVAIAASIESAETDLGEDGDKFLFIRRALPDITFRGSTVTNPSGVLTLQPLKNSGSGYNNPQSVAGSSNASVTRTATAPIEKFTGQVYIRIRARQLSLKFESTALGVQWQLGSMRIDARPDGRASGSGVSGG